jgi:carboxypeptidase C (cathepsin A)
MPERWPKVVKRISIPGDRILNTHDHQKPTYTTVANNYTRVVVHIASLKRFRRLAYMTPEHRPFTLYYQGNKESARTTLEHALANYDQLEVELIKERNRSKFWILLTDQDSARYTRAYDTDQLYSE